MKVDFCHLHLHTEYSMQDSLCRLEALFQKAEKLGMEALAMTDHHSVSGVIYFYKLAQQYGIKPLIGCELRVGSILSVEPEGSYHVTVLVQNERGYRNLLHLITYSNLDHHGIVTRRMLEKWSGGLIFLSGCGKSEVDEWIIKDLDRARSIIQSYSQLCGREQYYLEVERFGYSQEEEVIQRKVQLAAEAQIPLVATNNVHYLSRKDWEVFQALQDLQELYPKRARNEFYLKSPEEMAQLFSDLPEVVANTVKIAQRCNLQFSLDQFHLPHFIPPPGFTSDAYLANLTHQGLIRRYGFSPPDQVVEVLARELEEVQSLGFTNYFLFIWDLVQIAKRRGILLLGRGEVVSNLIGYLLEIINIDPFEQRFCFEPSFDAQLAWRPTIELLVDETGAEELINSIRYKYGKEKVAFLPELTTLSSQEIVKDLACVQMMGLSWKHRLNPFGIVISPEPLALYTALDFLEGDIVMSQLDAGEIDQLGLLQVNFSGNKFLSAVQMTLQILLTKGVELEYGKIPFDDPTTYRLLQRSKTSGCYLFGEEGCGKLLQQLQPVSFDELVFLLALDHLEKREMGLVEYLIGKAGEYAHPYLEELLDESYGVIIYEEQLILLARELAGFNVSESYIFSQILRQKDLSQIAGQKSKFVQRAKGGKLSAAEATLLFDQIYNQVDYLVSKADLMVTAQLAYATAYLKTHYRVEYLSSLFKVR